jgi:hypothetical protein
LEFEVLLAQTRAKEQVSYRRDGLPLRLKVVCFNHSVFAAIVHNGWRYVLFAVTRQRHGAIFAFRPTVRVVLLFCRNVSISGGPGWRM